MPQQKLESPQVHPYQPVARHSAKAYSAASATSPLGPTTIPRREPTTGDVQIGRASCRERV